MGHLLARIAGVGTGIGMCDQPTTQTPSAASARTGLPAAPLLVDARGLAGLLGLGYDTVKRLCALERWRAYELPAPVWIGRNSHRNDARSGQRRWCITEFDHPDVEVRAHRRVTMHGKCEVESRVPAPGLWACRCTCARM